MKAAARQSIKTSKCKICRAEYIKRSIMHKLCGSADCAVAWLKLETAKKELVSQRVKRRQYAADKKRIKSRADWIKEAQQSFNKWVRLRDEGQPCISCGSNTGKRNAGHYRSVGACPELRFEPNNCHVQCEKCNSWLSGNAIEYRINLIKKIGIGMVEWLEGPHAAKKYTIEEIEKIKAEYVRLAKELERDQEN